LKSDKHYASIPIIVLSAKHDVSAKVEGLTVGADDYMTKPFNCDLLLLRMKKLVETRAKNSNNLIDPEPKHIQVTSLDEKFVESAIKYVEDNMSRPDLSVEELSRHLGMSRVHLYKRLRQVTGKTPVEFIRVLRLKRAAQLLRESQLNVSEIAYQVGFNNPKYFSSYFRDEFGVLPSVYQEKECKATNYTPK
jgi:AraC-like DNA-binding protein